MFILHAQAMLVSVLAQTTVCLLELQFEYTRQTELRSGLRDEGQDAPNTEANPQSLQSAAEADPSGNQESSESTASESSSNAIDRYWFTHVNVPDAVGEYLESMDTQSFALQIAQQVPTLDHIGVRVSVTGPSKMYWEVVRNLGASQVSLSGIGDFWDGHQRFWQAPEETGE